MTDRWLVLGTLCSAALWPGSMVQDVGGAHTGHRAAERYSQPAPAANRRTDLLGATLAELEGTDIFAALEYANPTREGNVVTYLGRKYDGSFLRVTLDQRDRITRLVTIYPDLHSQEMTRNIALRATLQMAQLLLPKADADSLMPVMLSDPKTPDRAGRQANATMAVLTGRVPRAVLTFATSTLTIERTKQKDESWILLTVDPRRTSAAPAPAPRRRQRAGRGAPAGTEPAVAPERLPPIRPALDVPTQLR